MENIYVTKSFLPPVKNYQEYIDKIWQSNRLTNQGPLLKEFEGQASNYLGVKNFHFVSNGTVALQVALNGLNINSGEIITTPFSYAATVSAILWERCKPVFVDIDPETLCIDPNKIESAITKNTKAILPVHGGQIIKSSFSKSAKGLLRQKAKNQYYWARKVRARLTGK